MKLDHLENAQNSVSHLFIVDDLKTFAQDIQEAKSHLDLITKFEHAIW